jgi:hypothetical protein
MTRIVAGMVIALLTLIPDSRAAPYAVPQAVLAGGGGSSAGGTFEVTGTLGQGVVATSTGGVFELNGGFWTATVGVGTAPTLQRTVSRKLHGAAGSFDLDLGVVAPIPAADPHQTPASR